jgi:hypothetical protein
MINYAHSTSCAVEQAIPLTYHMIPEDQSRYHTEKEREVRFIKTKRFYLTYSQICGKHLLMIWMAQKMLEDNRTPAGML